MTEFKVGDRVRYTGNISNHLRGHVGVVIDFNSANNVNVNWGEMGERGVFPENIELVEPRRDTPKVGDTVRVVLEGKVTYVSKYGFDIADENTISPHSGREHVKSIEIIAPAKPSVRDLPTFTPVKVGPDVFIRVESGWYVTGRTGLYTDDEVDSMNWTLLVPKVDE